MPVTIELDESKMFLYNYWFILIFGFCFKISQDLQSFVTKSVKEIEHVMNVGNQNRAVGYDKKPYHYIFPKIVCFYCCKAILS